MRLRSTLNATLVYFKLARRQQCRRRRHPRHRVQVRPAAALPGEDDLSIRTPPQLARAVGLVKDASRAALRSATPRALRRSAHQPRRSTRAPPRAASAAHTPTPAAAAQTQPACYPATTLDYCPSTCRVQDTQASSSQSGKHRRSCGRRAHSRMQARCRPGTTADPCSSPRAWSNCCGFAAVSFQACRPDLPVQQVGDDVANSERSLPACPSPISRGVPPFAAMSHISCFTPAVSSAGFGAGRSGHSASPPRVYASHSPSADHANPLISCPSSSA